MMFLLSSREFKTQLQFRRILDARPISLSARLRTVIEKEKENVGDRSVQARAKLSDANGLPKSRARA